MKNVFIFILAFFLFERPVFCLESRQANVKATESAPRLENSFVLKNAQGDVVGSKNLLGQYALVFFGYTRCPDVCPVTLQAVTQAMDQLGRDAERVRPVFITVDPKHDTPAVLSEYFRAFDSRFLALTGSEFEIAKARADFQVFSKERPQGKENDLGSDHHPTHENHSQAQHFDHSAFLYLRDPEGHLITLLSSAITARDLAQALRKAMSH